MGRFFIDTQDGRVATQNQLRDAGLLNEEHKPAPPWHMINAPGDASTMWYSVMRKRTRGIFIGQLCLRHIGREASLSADGWEEVPVERIGVDAEHSGAPEEQPW